MQRKVQSLNIDLPTYDITEFNYQKTKAEIPISDEQIADPVKFYDDMYKADCSRIVFIKKEG